MKIHRGLLLVAGITLFAGAAPAQDIRGMERCTAEQQMDRRTGCLQANVEFLQQELAKVRREMQTQITAAKSDVASAKAENAALKAALAKLEADVTQLKTKAPEPAKK